MAKTKDKPLNAVGICLRAILRPAVRFSLRHSLNIQEFLDHARAVFVEIAEDELRHYKKNITISRLSIMTGIQRPLVKAYREGNAAGPSSVHFVARVISQWKNDKDFCSKSGKPRTLEIETDSEEFENLVRKVSTDLHPLTVLFEMERIGAAERNGDKVKLIAPAFRTKDMPAEAYRMLGRDVEEHLKAVMENIENEEQPENFHAYTSFDNVCAEDIPKLRQWLRKKSSDFHRSVEKYLSKYDLDVNPNENKTGGEKIGVGSFSR